MTEGKDTRGTSPRRRWPRALGAAVVVLVSALAGIYAVVAFAPDRFRGEVESLLADATGAPVSLASLRLVVGFPMHLEAQGLSLWNGALTLEYAAARLSPLSLLVGQPRLSGLEAEGVALTMTRVAPGRWEPDFDPEAPPPPPATKEPLLGPLEIFERTARNLLGRPTLADNLAVRRASIRYVEGSDGREVARIDALSGELVHRALRGDAEIRANADVRIAGGKPAAVEAQGTRSREGELSLSIAVTALDLSSLDAGRRRTLGGSLSGILDYDAETRGEGDLSLDFVVEELLLTGALRDPSRALETPHLAARVRASLSAGQLDIEDASVSAGALGVQLAATLERPIDTDAHMGLTLIVEEVGVDRARTVIDWLPGEARGSAEKAIARVQAGVLSRVEARGGADWGEWSRLLEGHTREMPWGMRLAADIAGLSVEVGEGDLLSDLHGRLVWTADRVEADVVQARFNGSPMPALDAEIHGVSHLFASDPRRRELVPGALPLPGLSPLWETLWGGDDPGADEAATTLALELDYIHHPALIWPVEDVRARILPLHERTRVEIEHAEWAGIPLEGTLLAHGRDKLVEARVVAGAPPEIPGPAWPRTLLHTPDEAGRIWATGRFEVGPIDEERWRQIGASGSFQASGDEVDVTGVTIALAPHGELQGAGWLELGAADRALFAVEASLAGGDVETLMGALANSDGVRGGTIDAEASLAGALSPELPLLSRLAGKISLEARAGAIRESVPAIVALALATDTLNAFTGHDEIRYDSVETTLHFEEGWVSTEAFDIDGPDLRMFASGQLDALREPHLVDAEFALFLFRQFDRALINIPLVNALLLGGDENLVAAYFSLEGPWEDPVATPMPLRTIAESPAGSVLTGIPDVMARGLRALGGILGGDPKPREAAPRRESGADSRTES